MNIAKTLQKLEKELTRKDMIKEDMKRKQKKRENLLDHLEDLSEARIIFQNAAQLSQQILQKQISGIVSNALSAVFEEPYEFQIEFVTRRNATECDLLFVKDGKTREPLESCGYGVADIASLALRVAFWKLDGNSRNTIILDEPTRNLSVDKQPLASMMIKKLSETGIQFIIVTHNESLTEAADKVFAVKIKNGESLVEEMA
jgi:DNA repair exonuclease SbcCD ATPase subunit